MKCVETFKSREAAGEKQRLLKSRGIEARVLVDPMDSMHPALGAFQDVGLVVHDDRVTEALAVLRGAPASKKAG